MTEGQGFNRKVHKIEWIPVGKISVVWANAQREFDEGHAKWIADNFDPDMVNPVRVTMPNGNGIYHCVDGQHTARAIEMLYGPDERAPCIVLPEADPARAASLFVGHNTNQKRPQPLQIFKVRVTAGNETAVAVNKIAASLGYRIENAHQDKNILAVAALESVYKKHGADVLTNTLKIIQATWGMDPNAVVSHIIRGYAAFIAEYGDQANWQRLKEVVQKRYTPGRFVGAAKTAREMTGGNMAEAVKKVLVGAYNRGHRGTHLKG